MDQALIEAMAGIGQAAIFAFAAYQFYRDGRSQDKLFITHLQEQNKLLLQAIMQQTFLRSPAISPAVPPLQTASQWTPVPTDLGERATAGGD